MSLIPVTGALVPDASHLRPWYFGVICDRCSAFIAVGRDPSDGRPGARFAGSGTIIATCTACGNRGRYAAARVEQRRAERPRHSP